MKTKEQMAREYALRNGYQMSPSKYLAYLAGFDECEKKMLEESSEGFEQFWIQIEDNEGHQRSPSNRNAKKAWVASRLSTQKELAENDDYIRELRKDLEWATSGITHYDKTNAIRAKHFGEDAK